MRTLAFLVVVVGFVVALCCWSGCEYMPEPPQPQPYPPAPPTPPVPPQPPEPPQPSPRFVSRAAMEAVEVGAAEDTLDALPLPDVKTPLPDGTTVRVWTINEPRPDGGYVRWEVHAREGKVTLSMPY